MGHKIRLQAYKNPNRYCLENNFVFAESTEISLEIYCIINHFCPVFVFSVLFHMHCRMIAREKHKAKPKKKKEKRMAVKRSHMGILFFSLLSGLSFLLKEAASFPEHYRKHTVHVCKCLINNNINNNIY